MLKEIGNLKLKFNGNRYVKFNVDYVTEIRISEEIIDLEKKEIFISPAKMKREWNLTSYAKKEIKFLMGLNDQQRLSYRYLNNIMTSKAIIETFKKVDGKEVFSYWKNARIEEDKTERAFKEEPVIVESERFTNIIFPNKVFYQKSKVIGVNNKISFINAANEKEEFTAKELMIMNHRHENDGEDLETFEIFDAEEDKKIKFSMKMIIKRLNAFGQKELEAMMLSTLTFEALIETIMFELYI